MVVKSFEKPILCFSSSYSVFVLLHVNYIFGEKKKFCLLIYIIDLISLLWLCFVLCGDSELYSIAMLKLP